GGGYHGVRPRCGGGPGDVRSAAPAVGRVRVRVRERTGGAGPREAHGGAPRPRPARAGLRTAGGSRQEVTLGRLVLAWTPVAVWFTLATFAIPLLGAALSKPA